MTGTGTQADPFAVDNFADFLIAASTAGAYVKIANDIDVAADDVYKNGMTSPIVVSCAHLYAYEKAIISGVIVEDVALINVQNNAEIENIDFLNCLQRGESAHAVVYSASNTACGKFTNCNFSITKVCLSNSGNSVTNYNDFDHCSFSISYVNVNPTARFFPLSKLTNCSIQLNGASIKYIGTATQHNILGDSTKCSVVGDIVSVDSGSKVRAFYKCKNCYAALNFKTDVTLFEVLPEGTNFVVTDISESNVTSEMMTLTSEQAKSKDHLLSIGFLP